MAILEGELRHGLAFVNDAVINGLEKACGAGSPMAAAPQSHTSQVTCLIAS